MSEIKPVANHYKRVVAELNLDDTDPFTKAVAAMCALAEAHQETKDALEWCQQQIYEHPAALAQARKEGEIAGMREAMEIVLENSATDEGYVAAKRAINRAIEEKSK